MAILLSVLSGRSGLSMLQLTGMVHVVTRHDENCNKMSHLWDVLHCIFIINRKRDEIIGTSMASHFRTESSSWLDFTMTVIIW